MSNTYHNPVTPYEILCELSFIISKQSTFKEVSIWLISVWSMHLPHGKFKHLETVIANTQRGRIEVSMLPQIKHCGGKQSNPKDLNFFSWLTMQRLTEGLSESLQKLSGGEQCNLHTIMGKPCTSLRSWDLQTKGTVDTPKVEVTPGPPAISKCDPRFASRDCIDPSLCNSFRFPFVLSRLILSIRIPPLGLRIIFLIVEPDLPTLWPWYINTDSDHSPLVEGRTTEETFWLMCDSAWGQPRLTGSQALSSIPLSHATTRRPCSIFVPDGSYPLAAHNRPLPDRT